MREFRKPGKSKVLKMLRDFSIHGMYIEKDGKRIEPAKIYIDEEEPTPSQEREK